jgi:hypothetical protein
VVAGKDVGFTTPVKKCIFACGGDGHHSLGYAMMVGMSAFLMRPMTAFMADLDLPGSTDGCYSGPVLLALCARPMPWEVV